MPQMAPLNWLILFMYFTLIFMITNPLNYFIYSKHPKTLSEQKISIKNSWSW